MRNRKAIVLILMVGSFCAKAQFRMPLIDVEVKVNQIIHPGNNDQSLSLKALETTNLHLAAHVQINQYIAVGWFYSTSMRGNGYNAKDFKFNFGAGDTKASSLFTGPEVRFSAGRAAKTRPYLSVSYCKAQIVENKGTYGLASDATAIGASLGIMRRFGNHLYWNIIEVGIKSLSQKLYWSNDGMLIDAKMGFTYNIGKRK